MFVRVETGDLIGDLKKAAGAGFIAAQEQILQDCNHFCLQDQGTLMASAITSFDQESGEITWNTPYARRRYYEHVRVKRGKNPNARIQWVDEAINQFSDTWVEQIKKGCEVG